MPRKKLVKVKATVAMSGVGPVGTFALVDPTEPTIQPLLRWNGKRGPLFVLPNGGQVPIPEPKPVEDEVVTAPEPTAEPQEAAEDDASAELVETPPEPVETGTAAPSASEG